MWSTNNKSLSVRVPVPQSNKWSVNNIVRDSSEQLFMPKMSNKIADYITQTFHSRDYADDSKERGER